MACGEGKAALASQLRWRFWMCKDFVAAAAKGCGMAQTLMSGRSGEEWPDQIFHKLREAEVRQVAYVPDAGHARLIELCRADSAMKATVLTTEEEGIGLLAGAWLGGERGVLLMQSS